MLLEIIPRWGLRDPISTISHVLGALFGVVALVALVMRAQRHGLERRAVWALAVYGISMVLGFTASASFHAPILASGDPVMLKKLDHAAIFVMIAGTGTALYGVVRARWTGPMIGVLWGGCLGALAVKMVVWPMTLWQTALIYVTVGWCALIGLFFLIRTVGWRRLCPLFWGAAVLTLGAVFFAAEWPVVWPGVVEGHEVFHGLALIGAGIHYWFIYASCTLPGVFEGDQCPDARTMDENQSVSAVVA